MKRGPGIGMTRRAARPYARRGAAYLIFLATATMVTVLGMTALAARRIDIRRSEGSHDAAEARCLARSAIEFGLSWINNDQHWRRTAAGIAWTTELPVGGGTMRIQAIDPVDGQIGNSEYDPVILRGTGICGKARQVLQVTLGPQVQPVDVLRACVHTDAASTITGGKTVYLTGGPMWIASSLSNSGWLVGDVEAQAVTGGGLVLGTVTKPTPHRDVKMSDIWELYSAKATTLPAATDWNGVVLGPGYSPWGAASADGVYQITTGNKDLRIHDTRILGTLLVDVGAKTLTLDSQVLLQAAKSSYPVLILKGNLELRLKSSTESLSENGENINYNPAGVPYEGVTDGDKSDTYPNRIEGLVYVTGNVLFKEGTRVNGTVLADGNVTFDATTRLYYDDALYTSPPEGFSIVTFGVQQGSWTRVVD